MKEILEKIIPVAFMIVGILATGVILSLLFAFPIKWCWNYIMPYLFGLKTITWGQAWCLSFLATSFFKNNITQKNKS